MRDSRALKTVLASLLMATLTAGAALAQGSGGGASGGSGNDSSQSPREQQGPAMQRNDSTLPRASGPSSMSGSSATSVNGMTAIDSGRTGEIYSGLTMKDLDGMDIIGADGKKVGEVDMVLAGTDGKASAVVVDVGGVMGIGADKVIVPLDRLKVDSQNKKFSTTVSEDQLKAMPKWTK